MLFGGLNRLLVSAKELMPSNCGVGEDSFFFFFKVLYFFFYFYFIFKLYITVLVLPGLQGDPTSPS